MATDKAIGGIGTNQYQVRGTSKRPTLSAPVAVPLPWSTASVIQSKKGVARRTRDPLYLASLAQDAAVGVRTAVAENPHCSPEILDYLSYNTAQSVRLAVANHPKTTPVTLSWLVARPRDADTVPGKQSSSDIQLCKAVAANPHCPPPTLAHLATSGNSSTAIVVAGNPQTPPETLALLARGKSFDMRRNIAGNPNCPDSLCRHLAKSRDLVTLQKLASNPRCPIDLLSGLAEIPDEHHGSVALRVAQNPNCPFELLKNLVGHRSDRVRQAVAAHANTPSEYLVALLEDTPEIREAVFRNPNCPAHIRAIGALR